MFDNFVTAVGLQFHDMCRAGALLKTDVLLEGDSFTEAFQGPGWMNPAGLWGAYLSSFESEEDQATHACKTCRSFIRQAGGLMVVTDSMKVMTLWDSVVDDPIYGPSARAMRDLVLKSKPNGLFYYEAPRVGTERNLASDNKTVWTHLHVDVPHSLVKPEKWANSTSAKWMAEVGQMQRALTEIPEEVVHRVIEWIKSDSIYRGQEHLHRLEKFLADLGNYNSFADGLLQKELFPYVHTQSAGVRNSAIGSLLQNLSEGMDDQTAVAKYESVMAPANYQRSKSLVTPRMIEAAKSQLSDLGLLGALRRRQLTADDIPVTNSLFVYRPRPEERDVFSELTAEANSAAGPKGAEGWPGDAPEISIGDFLSDVLPKSEKVEVFVTRAHASNFVTLTGPESAEEKPLFKWGSSYGWSYTGGVADSIKDRVKEAGGNVDGWMRISLAWFNHDDLDLHLVQKTPCHDHVYFQTPSSASLSARLDVDMNRSFGDLSDTPVENIDIAHPLVPGNYEIRVHNYCKRHTAKCGFEVEVEYGDGNIRTFSSASSPGGSKHAPFIEFTVGKDESVDFAENGYRRTSQGSSKWGLALRDWHTVSTIMTSPNHWEGETQAGNKHWFFILKGCVTDEVVLPFYNEFLIPELRDQRKVMEVVADKAEVMPAGGDELSGIGFSHTVRNQIIVKVNEKDHYIVNF